MPARRPKPRILIAVDLSEPSRRALEAGANLAQDLNAEVVLLHVTGAVEPPSFQGVPAIGAPGLDPAHPDPYEGAETVALNAVAQDWASYLKGRGLMVDAIERGGKAAKVIVAEAQLRGCLLIVVGHTAGAGVKSMLLGSVAKGLVAKSPLPVLVVPYDPSAPVIEGLPGAQPARRRSAKRPKMGNRTVRNTIRRA